MPADLGQFSQMPPQVRAVLMFLAGSSVISLLFAFNKQVGLIALMGLFTMGCLIAFYRRIMGWLGKKKASAMSGQIAEHSSAAPTGINEPAKRARLDDMKRNFDTGLEKFRTSGKDVYKLPWYLIVGEPGSGKTEAVRHCNVGFPPGLQDELQGVGGTINMNWWFTNHAVMLDTAGRLMFEEVKPGETSEWREFLQLLRRNRPNCPVNGLLLVIPADSLIRDATESISSKAGKIAQQLDVIQRTLDVRFPVFILITKCDLLSGFREFFEGLNDPHSQHQMIGWTNPEPRDAVFQPNRVVEFLQTVIDRVRKRRLGLLRDPVPEKDGAKRIDEVDALFSLPHSLSLIGPRLRSYLETIFVAGEWSAKPLFLRGIYFTSAMREGAALDQELAEALGVSLDDLPEGKAWERERAYFLRDMFMEKAFREKGLVTRATNTNQLLRRRRLFLWGSLGLALLSLLSLSFFGFVSLKNSVGQQSQYWGPAKEGWDNGVWHPIVEKDAAGHYQYKGDQPVSPTTKDSLIDYYGKIRELCEKNIDVGWIYLPMARFTRLEGDRKKAQRILLEASVINPLVKESRRVMTDPAHDKPPADVSAALLREAEGVATLVGIESDAISHNRDVSTIPDSLVAPLIRYTTGQEKPADPGNFKALSNTIDWTYTKNPNGVWPPPWLPIGSTTLASNKPIDAGIQRMLKFVDESLKTQESGLANVRRIRDLLRAFRQQETEMNTMATSAEAQANFPKLRDAEPELGKTKVALDAALKEAGSLVPGERFTISRAYERLVGQSQTQSKAAFDVVEQSVADYVKKGNDPVNTNHQLFVQVDAKLKDAQTDIAKRIAGGFSEQEQQELKALDQALLADFGNGKRMYEVRWDSYDACHQKLYDKISADQKVVYPIVGKDWKPMTDLENKIDRQRQAIAALHDKVQDPFSAVCKYYLDSADLIVTGEALQLYVKDTRARFNGTFHYPLVKDSGSHSDSKEVSEAERLLTNWKRELNSDAFQRIGPALLGKANLQSFLAAIDLITPGNASLNGSVTVAVLDYSQSPRKEGLNRFRKVSLGKTEYDTSTSSPSGTYSYGGTFSAEFIDYTVDSQKRVAFSRSISNLLSETKSGGGRVEITVDGLPIYLEVTPKGQPPPDPERLPDKQRILATLN